MILYFSATGNTRHLVEEIALENEEVISIEKAMKEKIFNIKIADKRVGFLFPTYEWGMPSIVKEYLEKTTFEYAEKPYIFYVGTFGTTTGAAYSHLDRMLKKKDLKLDAGFDIRFPDTWTVIFDLSDKARVESMKIKANQEIEELKTQLAKEIRGKHLDQTVPAVIGDVAQLLYQGTRKTKNLNVSDSCIGCGLCEKKCPVNAIEMRDDKPIWVKEQCTMCLGCLHRCPKYAIYYKNGKATNAHGQYVYK